MRLIRLALTNFRQHAESELEFRSGLTGIIGPNGTGKTTILEALAWAIYGTSAVRGTLDTLRFNRAPGRSRVQVELEFELGPEGYRVVRHARGAELYRLPDRESPIAAGITEVTRQLTRRLGMDRDEFFNTYFTGQKELQFLAAMKPNERRLFLSQVLGYERLRAAQARVREERNVLRGQVEELRRGLGDADELARATEEAEKRTAEASAALDAAERKEMAAAEEFAELEPAWSRTQSERERDRQLSEELRLAETKLAHAEKTEREAAESLEELAGLARRLEVVREQIKPLEAYRAEEERLRELADAAARRRGLEEQLTEQRARVDALAHRRAEVESRIGDPGELAAKLEAKRKECAELEAARDEAKAAWLRDRQDVEARLRMLIEQAEALKGQLSQLEEAGPDGVCPTCQRPLGEEYDRVVEQVRGQYEEVVEDGKWHRKREEQLAREPESVTEAESATRRAREEFEALRSAQAQAQSAQQQLRDLDRELEDEQAKARGLAGELAAIPEGYDPEQHAEVRSRLEELGEVEKRATQLETKLEAEPRLRARKAEAGEEAEQIRSRIAELRGEREALEFSEEEFTRIRGEFEAARSALQEARLAVERGRGDVDAARKAVESARRAEQEHRERLEAIRERERQHRLHNELDAALGALRDELNDRVRPELSEIASVFLTELTDGRYNQIEIGPDYDVVVLDDGEEKPVISGGEEDLANLVLRLAISQMIADRAGQTLSLLIFDEVFGGLDDQRRESVVRLLQRLQDRFDQVVLITHIESIRDGMDQVVRVEYDEVSGASVVREESPGASEENLQVEDLAALAAE